MKSSGIKLVLFLTFAMMSACKAEKEPIKFGTDACEHCKMIAMDPKFGAEIITTKGKIYKFDDVNCLVTYMNNSNLTQTNIAEIYVIDFSHAQLLVNAKTAFYVHSDQIKSPMASGVAAFETTESRYEQQQTWQGTELNWEEINSKFK